MSTDTLSELTPEQVSQFLTENPTFFLKHEHLLADLYLPHASGEAVSLFERQVNILRERNIEMRKRHNDMLEQGQRNDILFQKTRDLILNLLASRSLNDLAKKLTDYCSKEFQVDQVQFSLFANPDLYRNSLCRVVSLAEAERSMPSLPNAAECISGVFREDEFKFLFADQYSDIASAIVLPLRNNGTTIGMLAMGSNDARYFQAGMDTLFLTFIGEVISGLLPRYAK